MTTVLYKQQECILTGRVAVSYAEKQNRRQDNEIKYIEVKLKDDDGVETTEWVLPKDLLLIKTMVDTNPNFNIQQDIIDSDRHHKFIK